MKNQRAVARQEVQEEVHFKMETGKIKGREGLFGFNLINKNFFSILPTRLTQQPTINLIKIGVYTNNFHVKSERQRASFDIHHKNISDKLYKLK